MSSTDQASPRENVFGVDFSGAARAGEKIWIAHGRRTTSNVEIDECRRAAALVDSSPALIEALAALRRLIQSVPTAIFGFDFPFGLPEAVCRTQNWEAEVLSHHLAYPTAEDFRRDCLRRAGGRELQRLTDREARTPFSSYNLRLYRQTDAGLRHLLAPLIAANTVAVAPMQSVRSDRALLIEVCPASTLKRMGIYQRFTGYKGRSAAAAIKRRAILEILEDSGGIRLSSPVLRTVAEDDAEGDALDSIVAALAAARARVEIEGQNTNINPLYRLEGFVYS
ncbi:MAG TPA: DUF429 domain-containing protein [Chloroflexota bacterium]|nr:DUF429 domain-containing protein [Chloroflexota bacterium]